MNDDALKSVRDEVFRKLGRNIALFQQLERQLKQLIAHSVIEGSSLEDYEGRLAARHRSVLATTLGGLVGRYTKGILSPPPESDEANIASDALVMRTQFQIDTEDNRQKVATLSTLVKERNRLVHHLFEDFDLYDVDGVERLDTLLEAQAERVRSEIHDLNATAKVWQEQCIETARFFESAEGKRCIDLMLLQSSKIVTLVATICCEIAREDGWSVLSLAASRVNEIAPDQLANIKVNHGHATLKSLLLATQCFEFRQETTAKGTRDLFRITRDVGRMLDGDDHAI